MDSLAKLSDEDVYLISSPVTDGSEAAGIVGVELLVGDDLTGSGVGIEVVVHVNAIYIIAADDVIDDLADIVPVLLQCRIEDILSVVRKHALGMCDGNMIRGQGCRCLCLGSIRIDPRVQFHASLMALFDHPLQWIPIGIWRFALHAREEAAPWFVFAGIECVTFSTHLKDDSVHAVGMEGIELLGQRTAHLVRCETVELSVDTLNPCTAELTFLSIAEHDL